MGYEVINPVLKPSKQMKWLKENNVITVTNKTVKSIDNEGLSELLLETRKEDPYDIDGIIVVNDKKYERTNRKCPKHAFAFKMVLSDQIMESQVVAVHWQISKNGYIIPKIQVVPVEIGGATITYCSGHNAAFIEKNKIGVGAILQMVRSGDVIPKVHSVVQPVDEPSMPTVPYIWNESHVDILLQNINENKTVQMKKILSFVQTLDVPSFGPGNVKKVFDCGFDTIPKVLTMKKEDFLEIPGFKDKMALKISQGMAQKLDEISLPDLMVATNIFARGIGKSRAKSIMENYPNILTSDASDDEKVKMITKLEGFSNKTAELFVPYIETFMTFIQNTSLERKLEVKEAASLDTNHPLYGKKIVMTGFRDKLLEKTIQEVGGIIGNSVSKNTFMLLVDTLDSDSGKADKARSYKVKMMTPYAFNNHYLE